MVAMAVRKFEIGLFSLGALKALKPDIAFYEPIPEWVTGMAIVQFAEGNRTKRQSSIVKTMVFK